MITPRNRVTAALMGAALLLAGGHFVRSQPLADESAFREYAGAWQWGPGAFLYVQLWDEFTGFGKPRQLVAFDESGEVRSLYPAGKDQFITGPGMALSTPVESRIAFQRDGSGKIVSLTWAREGSASRTARRAVTEKREDVRFQSGSIQLAGTLYSPLTRGKHPAIILVHGSGAENRDYMLPWARFLIRRGVAVLGYDKRGVGESSGDWNTASFQDLAGDVVSAFEYLKSRKDIDATQVGLMGISQAGWIMPLAAVRAKGLAFMISISGAGVSPAETTLDQARNEMSTNGMPAMIVDQIVTLMKLQYRYVETGEGWEEYASAREKIVARMGKAPDSFPGTQDNAVFQNMRRYYFYDPTPTLKALRAPTLAIWGELDNNITANKNKPAWEEALKDGGNRDYTLAILPKANHSQWEAKLGSNAEAKSLQRFVPEYFTTVQKWLATHVRTFEGR